MGRGHSCGEQQLEFDFWGKDRICRTCKWANWKYGSLLREESNGKDWWIFGCVMGQYPITRRVYLLKNSCRCWERGRECMGFVDFKKMSEEQLRRELEQIRAERCGVGRQHRSASREGRIQNATKSAKVKQAEEGAEWV